MTRRQLPAARRACAPKAPACRRQATQNRTPCGRAPARHRCARRHRARAPAATASAIGWTTPVSLFAAMTVNSARPFAALASACAADETLMTPSRPTGSATTFAPEARAGASTESCSIALTQIGSQPAESIQLLASVAPLVNTTWLGSALTRRATFSRAASMSGARRATFRVHRRRIAGDVQRGKHRRARFAPQRARRIVIEICARGIHRAAATS